MKIFKLTRLDDEDYEYYDALVIRAHDEDAARELASDYGQASERDAWLDPRRSSVEEVTQEGDEDVILGSYVNG